MKNLTILAAVLVTVGTLTACSTGAPTATTTVTATPTPAAPEDRVAEDTTSDDDVFVAAYESEFGDIDADTESALVSLGHTICDSLDGGLSFDTVATIAMESDLPEYESGFIVGDAISVLCPVYTGDMTDWLEANGIDTSGINA